MKLIAITEDIKKDTATLKVYIELRCSKVFIPHLIKKFRQKAQSYDIGVESSFIKKYWDSVIGGSK